MTVSKKLRFEVFKRDKFTCQYCGRQAPDVLLHVDHIMPVSAGGAGDITNLITACQDCNLGKSDRQLSDDSALKKQKTQLDALQERREQLEMMMEWQRGLTGIEEDATENAVRLWEELVPPSKVTDQGREEFKRLIGKYGFAEVAESMRISVRQYVRVDPTTGKLGDSTYKAFDYIGRIARVRHAESERPYLRELHRICGLCRKKFTYFDSSYAMDLLERAYARTKDTDELMDIARWAWNWSTWRRRMEDVIDDKD